MRRMTTTGSPDSEPQAPGERRLARPPSERYRTAEQAPEAAEEDGGSGGRALAFGGLAAIGVGVAIAIAGGVALVTAGLIALAGLGGWVVAIAVRAGGIGALTPERRIAIAVVLAALGVLGGQLGLWLFARYEGGVLGPVDYLAETFGLLVPIELAAAIGAAWLAAR
jgi:hypothetical protein